MQLILIFFNPEKCVLVIFDDSDFFMDHIRIQMYGHDIQNVKSGKHLGYIISSRGSLVNFEPVIRDMKVRTNVIINLYRSTFWQSKVCSVI